MDNIDKFGLIAHNLAPDVELILLGMESDVKDPLEYIVTHASLCYNSLDHNIAHDYVVHKDIMNLLNNLAEDGMAGHQYALGGQTHVSRLANQMVDLYKRKNADYGNSFDKSMNKYGLVVAVIRLGDKINRLQSLLKKQGEVKDESIADTFIDLACYSIMTMMWLEEKNKK